MLVCGHYAPYGSPVCPHIRPHLEPWQKYVKWYVGAGLDVELICSECADRRGHGADISVDLMCEECFDNATNEVAYQIGVRGTPEIRTRSKPFDFTLREIATPSSLGSIIDLAPIVSGLNSIWLLLGEDGAISRFDAEIGDSVPLASSSVPSEPGHKAWAGHQLRRRLHASKRGDFAAVVNDYGHHGQVIDLATGKVTKALDGGDYHPETVPFSLAFAESNGGTLVIHRTAWNRLDISDPSTGKLLTERRPTSYQRGEERPEHYLDYFHGALHISPNGELIVDDGWIWHPVGIPTVWSLERWVTENVWESEGGSTKRDICARDYYWDHAIVWLTDSKVVVGGIGDDDNDMIDGARIFDIAGYGDIGPNWRQDSHWAQEVASFAGPAGTFFADGELLFSSDAAGLSRWDPVDGARTGLVPNFHPTRQHPGTTELAELSEGVLRLWRAKS